MAAFAAALKPTPAEAYLSAQEQYDSIISRLRSPQCQGMRHDELEQLLEVEGRELHRRLLQAHLDERGPGTVSEPVIDEDGREHTHQRLESRSIKTIFGKVNLARQGYGGRELESLHPLDAELNLSPEKYSQGLHRQIAEAASKESYDETGATIQQQTGVKVPKRQLEQCVRRAAQDFALFYEQQRAARPSEVTASSEILVLTMDQKGVPMRKADLLEATRKAAEERSPRLKHRRSKGEKPHSKRLSTVAAVYTIAPFVRTPEQIVGEMGPVHQVLPPRPRPEDKRLWASVSQPLDEVLIQTFEEAARRDPQQTKQWVSLVDGDESQLETLKLAAKQFGVSLVIILDIIHVLEYLWKAAWAFHDEGDSAAEAWVSQRLTEILRGHSSLVAAGIRRSATLRELDAKRRIPIDKCADYLLKYAKYLRYDQYLAQGYPIATGVIEGACRYLVKDRMEITGARWGLEGAEAILRLRSLRASGDFDQYWEFHLEQEYRRNHASKYEDGRAPSPALERNAPHLQLVIQAQDETEPLRSHRDKSSNAISLKNRNIRKR